MEVFHVKTEVQLWTPHAAQVLEGRQAMVKIEAVLLTFFLRLAEVGWRDRFHHRLDPGWVDLNTTCSCVYECLCGGEAPN